MKRVANRIATPMMVCTPRNGRARRFGEDPAVGGASFTGDSEEAVSIAYIQIVPFMACLCKGEIKVFDLTHLSLLVMMILLGEIKYES